MHPIPNPNSNLTPRLQIELPPEKQATIQHVLQKTTSREIYTTEWELEAIDAVNS